VVLYYRIELEVGVGGACRGALDQSTIAAETEELVMKDKIKDKRPHRDQRCRDKCFPGAESEVFSPKGGGYAPLPYISRELLRHLRGAELRVWI